MMSSKLEIEGLFFKASSVTTLMDSLIKNKVQVKVFSLMAALKTGSKGYVWDGAANLIHFAYCAIG